MQPGQTITPGQPAANSSESPAQQAPAPDPAPVPQATQPEAPNNAQSSSKELPDQPPEDRPSWQFNGGETTPDIPQAGFSNPTDNIEWTASEYVSHDKNIVWFAMAGGVTVLLVGIIYLVTREAVSAIVIGILGVAFAVFAARPPRVLSYVLDHHGVRIGTRGYPYELFRSFSVLQEGAMRYIMLMPLQRFGIPITIYYDPADEDSIIEMLGSILPQEERRVSPVDSLMHRIRF